MILERDTMYALSGWQPWFWAISEGYKRIENRPWKAPNFVLGRRIAIHAAQRWDPDGEAACRRLLDMSELPKDARTRGAVIAVATVAGCVDSPEGAEAAVPGHGRWFSGPFAWVLKDIRKLTDPVPCRGFQKLWRLKPEQQEKLDRQIRHGARP